MHYEENKLPEIDTKLGIVAMGEDGKIAFKIFRVVVKPDGMRTKLDYIIPFALPVDLSPDTCILDLVKQLPQLSSMNLSYSITPKSEESKLFYIDGTTICYTDFGAGKRLPRSTQLYIHTFRNDFPIEEGTIQIQFQVGSLNSYAPLFSQTSYSFTISPLTTPGTNVGQVHAIDSDRGGNPYGVIRYQVMNFEMPFEVDPISGKIRLIRQLSSTIVRYIFRVEARDSGLYSKNSQVQVEVKVKNATNAASVFKHQMTECIFPSRGDCTVRLLGLQRAPPSFKLKSCDNFRISPVSGLVTMVTNRNKNTTQVCHVCTGRDCAMVALMTKSVIKYPHVFNRSKETIKYIPANRLIKKVNANYKLFISPLISEYFIANGYIQTRRPVDQLKSNYHVTLPVLELSPQPKLFELIIDRRTRTEITTKQNVQVGVHIGNQQRNLHSILPLMFNGAGFVEIKSDSTMELLMVYSKMATDVSLLLLETDIGLLEIAHLNDTINLKSSAWTRQVQINTNSTYTLTFAFASTFVIKDQWNDWTISESRLTVYNIIFGYNPFNPSTQPFIGQLFSLTVNGRPITYRKHELDAGMTSMISGSGGTQQICVDFCQSRLSCQSSPFGVQCPAFCTDQNTGALEQCTFPPSSTRRWQQLFWIIGPLVLVLASALIFRQHILFKLPRKYTVLSRLDHDHHHQQQHLHQSSHHEPDDQKPVISYDPRERTLLPRVRFNANTGQVLQSVAEEDELVLSTFNRCLTSLSDSDETENELFV